MDSSRFRALHFSLDTTFVSELELLTRESVMQVFELVELTAVSDSRVSYDATR
jgi:hypothetical protein